jgi:hypothetical protein
MQNYGMIIGGQLFTYSVPIDGCKPIDFEPIPFFDEATQYIIQTAPVEEENRIFMGIEVHELPIDEGEHSEFVN